MRTKRRVGGHSLQTDFVAEVRSVYGGGSATPQSQSYTRITLLGQSAKRLTSFGPSSRPGQMSLLRRRGESLECNFSDARATSAGLSGRKKTQAIAASDSMLYKDCCIFEDFEVEFSSWRLILCKLLFMNRTFFHEQRPMRTYHTTKNQTSTLIRQLKHSVVSVELGVSCFSTSFNYRAMKTIDPCEPYYLAKDHP